MTVLVLLDSGKTFRPQRITKAALRTLYVKRKLLNADQVRAWAASLGIESTLAPDDMHVTIAYSRELVDWSLITPDPHQMSVVERPGREVHQFPPRDTPNGALVLKFQSAQLQERWQELRDAGASWAFPEYHPHVTLTYSVAEADVAGLAAYEGPLNFGPEIFSEVKEDWANRIEEVPLAKAGFDPNQPRNPAGGAGGGRWVSAFHGTSTKAWEDIKANGLVPGKGGGADAWLIDFATNYPREPGESSMMDFVLMNVSKTNAKIAGRAASVYMTLDEGEARDYALNAAEVTDSEGVLLRIKVPAGDRKLVNDEASGAYRYQGTIPAKYIELVEVGRDGMFENDPRWKTDAAKRGAVSIYAVVVMKSKARVKSTRSMSGE